MAKAADLTKKNVRLKVVLIDFKAQIELLIQLLKNRGKAFSSIELYILVS